MPTHGPAPKPRAKKDPLSIHLGPRKPAKSSRNMFWSLTIQIGASIPYDPVTETTALNDFVSRLPDLPDDRSVVRSILFSLERGAETGQYHYQAVVRMTTAVRFAAVQKIFRGHHLEPAIDSKALVEYVQKGETHIAGPYTWHATGDAYDWVRDLRDRSSLKLSDLQESVMQSGTLSAAYEMDPLMTARSIRTLEAQISLRSAALPKPEPIVLLITGPPGVGKSLNARTHCQENGYATVYSVPCSKKYSWFDGYNGTDCVVFEDVDWETIPSIGVMKNLLDRYDIQVERKGGHVWFKPPIIILTSNCRHPRELYPAVTDVDFWAFSRRICTWVNMTSTTCMQHYKWDSDTHQWSHAFDTTPISQTISSPPEIPKEIPTEIPSFSASSRPIPPPPISPPFLTQLTLSQQLEQYGL